MAVLRESPWYREIYQDGRQEGVQTGWRFASSADTVQELSNLLRPITDLPKLESLLIAAAQVESLEAFRARLNGADRAGGNGSSHD